ncbi:hypothetical protein IV203_015751 [Nitzschia inconspicua]|uniref:Uncharacterized protein n=1 Tax=Nitzschia inconspicua TaxID=303405 RepID=A0A9K3LBU2_9STRA|nr:hypothetical protein IV203_015751 [Nitzschia inconspicua]
MCRQTVDLNTLRMSNEGLSNLIQHCIASRFGRHKGTAMMAAGSRNEEPTIQKLRPSLFPAVPVQEKKKRIGGFTAKSCYEVWHERTNLALDATKQRKRLQKSREQEDADAKKRRKLSANANSQKNSPSKSPGPSQDAQFEDEEEQPDEDELVEEDQEDEQEGDNTDEQDIEEIEEQYYDDVIFMSLRTLIPLRIPRGKRRRIQNNFDVSVAWTL